MSASAVLSPFVSHRLPGRVRLKVPQLTEENQYGIESEIKSIPGVTGVRAEPLTGNVLVQYDPGIVDERKIIAAAKPTQRKAKPQPGEPVPEVYQRREPHAISVVNEGKTRHGEKVVSRVRIAVRGLDRDGALANKVIEQLMKRPGVRASASVTTGRVLVEFDEGVTQLRELLGDIIDVELPGTPGEDNPSHPLDPAPLNQSAVRTAGAALGLSVLAGRRLFGATEPISTSPAIGYVGGVVSMLQGIPWIRNGVKRIAGRNNGDLILTLPDIAMAAIVGSPLGLLVNGVGALRLLLTVSARRQSWRKYEERLGDTASAQAGSLVRVEAGERVPLTATVVEGSGTAIGFDGLALHFCAGDSLPAGAKLRGGGPFVLELQPTEAFEITPRPAEPAPTLYDKYHEWNAPISLVFAGALGLFTRSAGRAFEALLCLSPRAATAGAESANLSATTRVIQAGVVVVGSRPNRHIRLPNSLILESTRVLTDGLEIAHVEPLVRGLKANAALLLAAEVSGAAGSPWGDAFGVGAFRAEGGFDSGKAEAWIDGVKYLLEPHERQETHRTLGQQALLLSRKTSSGFQALAKLVLRPRLAPGLPTLLESCRRRNVEVLLVPSGDTTVAREVGKRAGVAILEQDPIAAIHLFQSQGQRVAYLSDSALGAQAFAQCDLAIGLSSGKSGRFSARADLLAPDLTAVAAIMEAGATARSVVRDSVGFGTIANLIGAMLCLRGPTGVVAASRAVHLATLGAFSDAALRFRGSKRKFRYTDRYADPHPEERWGKRTIDEVLFTLDTNAHGLSSEEAQNRLQQTSLSQAPKREKELAFLKAIWTQLQSPMIGLMSLGAALTLAVGTPIEFGLVAVTIFANILFGAWQDHQVSGASNALVDLAPTMANVIRDRVLQEISSRDLVAGDMIVLSSGDRVPADARILESSSLEVDESSLTGESLPVPKSPESLSPSGRVILEGSDVTVGRCTAVVVAVGRKTRLGSIAASLSQDEEVKSPLNTRLAILLKQFLPLAFLAGAVVFGAGIMQGREWVPELVLGTTLALAAIPEGLPLLAGVAEVAVAKRLAKRKAILRRLGAVEALGRVDVACTDKTGTLTQGHLVLSLVAGHGRVAPLESADDPPLSPVLREIVLAAALASPHPEAIDVRAHPTDMAILKGAERIGLGEQIGAERYEEVPFEPTRGLHATRVLGRVVVKGAPEEVLERCTQYRSDYGDVLLDDAERAELHKEVERIASRGMRVLMVAEGRANASVEEPNRLTVLGLLGIRDPLREGVHDAIRRCKQAGVRVIMLTGDHPATAKAIATDAGLMDIGQEILTGTEVSVLDNDELDKRLKNVAVIARLTPMDKVRIVEGFQRLGHTVAMTGDGVNDAPALRLADVGVAMGIGGTEVARQAADVVLADDDFETLVEALVEGRGFWRNIRRTLGLLLGGILGETGLVAVATAIGLPSPLNVRQILSMNLITFGLPTLAVALQEPEHRNLSGLAREGTAALEGPLRQDVLRRAGATMLPSLAAYLLALPLGAAQAQTVAFGTAICSQLAQTLESGRAETGLTKSVVGAVGMAFGLLVASLAFPQARMLLSLALPSMPALALIALASCSAPLVARLFGANRPTLALPGLAKA